MGTATIDSERFRRRFDAFNEIGATERGGVDRPSLSDANRQARDTLVEWFEDAGLDVRIDEMGNIFGRRAGEREDDRGAVPSDAGDRESERGAERPESRESSKKASGEAASREDAAPVMFGSHVDSQYNGGRFDGVVGVLGGLEVIEALNDAGETTERPLEVVAWSNEEGVRFQPDMLGSGVYCDVFDLEYAYDRTDKEGNRFGEELERIGYRGDVPCEAGDIHAYFEIHVEQGPFLEREGLPVAAVEGVFGFSWMNVAFEGQANHAGPTPMNMRHDALVGTADVIRAVRRITATEGTDLVGTVGSVDVWPDAINVIPERVEFTVDFRSYDDAAVDAAVERIQEEIATAAEREGLEYEFEQIMRVDAAPFDADCIETVVGACETVGCEYTRLVSGAGHDANYLNEIAPASMIFVPSVDGISHRESEFTEWEDVVTGTEVLLEAVREKAAE